MKNTTIDGLEMCVGRALAQEAHLEACRRLRELVPLLERAEFEGKHGDHVTSLAFVRQGIALAKGGEKR